MNYNFFVILKYTQWEATTIERPFFFREAFIFRRSIVEYQLRSHPNKWIRIWLGYTFYSVFKDC